MPAQKDFVPLGDVINEAITDALGKWAAKHGRFEQTELQVSDELVGYQITFAYWRRKPSYLWIEVTAKRPWQSETFGYRLLTSGARHASPTYQVVT